MPISSTRGSVAGASLRNTPMPPTEEESSAAARESQDQALRQQLARETTTTRSQRRTDRDLLLASLRTHEEKVCDVRTRDEKDDADGAEQNPEDTTDVADHLLAQRFDVRLQPQRGKTGNRIQERDHAPDVGIRFGKRDARPQACQCLKAKADEGNCSVGLQRKEHRGISAREPERLGQHAHNLGGLVVDFEHLTDDVAGSAELSLPIAVGQNHAQWTARPIVFFVEQPAKERPDSQQRKRTIRHGERLDTLRLTATGDRDFLTIPCPNILERPLMVAIREIGDGALIHLGEVDAWPAVIQRHQTIRLGKGQRLQ